MKITLISFYFLNPGIRYLSSYLKKHGYNNVEIVFLPADNMYNVGETYSQSVLDDLIDICRDSDIVGISVFTNDYFRAVRLTKYLKANINATIIWGGLHPTVAPETCPAEVDYIYVGEGEGGILELVERLANKQEIATMNNICFWNGGSLHSNALRPLLRGKELDHFQDFDLGKHFIRKGNKIVKVNADMIPDVFSRDCEGNTPAYIAIFSRGCPHGCAYCCNNKINKLYSFEKDIYRSKTADGMIGELKYVLNKLPFIKLIYICDDNFLVNDTAFLKVFARLYKEEIPVHFTVTGSPPYISEEKVRILKDAGLREIQLGVQSGSVSINEKIYKRRVSRDSVVKAAGLINKYHLRARYDFIFDNPYENFDDELETAKLILNLPKPYILQSFSLTFFPGTELYDRAKRDGFIFNERIQVFEKVSNEFYSENVTYLKFICLLLPRLPYWLGKVLISRPVAFALHRNLFKGFYKRLYLSIYYLRSLINDTVKTFKNIH